MADMTQQDQESRRNKQLVMIWCAVIVAFIGSMIAIVKFSNTTPQVETKAPIPDVAVITDADHFKGGKDAKAVLLEYSDFECPACGLYFPLVKQLHMAFGDKIKIVYRHFPLVLATNGKMHLHSADAAQASEAANVQGKFWEMHDMLFTHQEEWAKEQSPRAKFLEYAKTIGLDVAKFEKDLDDPALRDIVVADFKSGEKAGVSATPTFFLNGKQLDQPKGLDDLKNQVQAILDTAK